MNPRYENGGCNIFHFGRLESKRLGACPTTTATYSAPGFAGARRRLLDSGLTFCVQRNVFFKLAASVSPAPAFDIHSAIRSVSLDSAILSLLPCSGFPSIGCPLTPHPLLARF